jgi:hypothetical protein
MFQKLCGSLAVLCFSALFGCGNKTYFDAGRAKAILEMRPVDLDGEQVSLTSMQVDCGVQAELWEPLSQVSQDRTTARLNAKARELKFNDDVVLESRYHQPYVQVRGPFSLQVDVISVEDGEVNGTKIVEAKAAVKITHSCFPNPLPIMGVKKGNFQENLPVSFEFRLYDDGWRVQRLVH